ncbi:LRFN5 [Branchiostoma lanceolatum]|uniref:LRFN5 protein n=1 Tax=Branchiostoma lanceolatum TaxID=7740 RepID=A0A8K0A870_BRALA|nr:LRFN5 [Branchiostoma lanceolatum]
MADPKVSLYLLFLLAFDPSQAGPSCPSLCEIKRSGSCPNPRGVIHLLTGSTLPCAKCNTAGQADKNQLECLPGTLKKLQVAGHSDRNGKLKTLPRLGELRMLILGPGSIHTAAEETFESVSSILALSMSKNAIKAVGSWFGGLAKLEKLFLSWNEIIEIKENVFQPLVRLGYLELRHNRLRAVEEWHFASLTNLEYLHLSYNNISHVAGRSFNRLSRLNILNLDHNQLSSLSTEWVLGLSATMTFLDLKNNLISTIPATLPANMVRRRVYLKENPFRCTCALGSFESLDRRVYDQQKLQCSYPPSLSGRKIADVPKGDMPCPSPTAKVSRQDHGASLVCEVFWEKLPEIRWLDPGGRAIGERGLLYPCGGGVTTRSEHEFPTTQSPERRLAHSTDDPGLPYIGKSTFTLRMSQQAYRCWTEGSFRCVVQSASGNVFADLPLTKSSQESQQDQKQEHTVMPAAFPTTPTRRNARITEMILKATDKDTREDGTARAADKAQRQTTMTAVSTSKPTRQNGRMTESIVKTTDKNSQKDGTTPAVKTALWQTVTLIFMGIISAIVALLVLKRAVAKCYKKLRPQRHDVQGNAAGAIGGIPLQNIQPPAAAPTTGNPLPPHLTYDEIPDDTPITPYAETSRLENPVYGADVTRPIGATSIPDHRPRSNRPPNSSASSRPHGSGTTRARNVPNPPPRPNGPADSNDSNYYPPSTQTTQAAKIPDPLPRTNRYVNSNVSSQPQDLEMPQARRIPDPLPRTHTYVNSNVSSQQRGRRMATVPRSRPSSVPQGLGMDEEEDVEGPNIYFDLNGPPRPSSSKMRPAEDVPDPLPRTNRYVNSNVSSQQRGMRMTTMPRRRPYSVPRGLGMDEDEDVEGPDIYFDLNGPPRPSSSMMRPAEDVPDPLPRTNRYVNSDVFSQQRGRKMATLPGRRHSSHPQGFGMDEDEDVEGSNIYFDLNGPPRPSSSKMRPAEDVPDPLPRNNRYVNSNVSSQQRGSKMATMPRRRPTSNPRHKEEEVEGPNIYLDLNGRGRPVTFWAP